MNAIELRVVLNRPLSDDEREATVQKVQDALGHAYEVRVIPIPSVERGPTGKFEEFLSHLD